LSDPESEFLKGLQAETGVEIVVDNVDEIVWSVIYKSNNKPNIGQNIRKTGNITGVVYLEKHGNGDIIKQNYQLISMEYLVRKISTYKSATK
jgi:hypothetical protein